MQWAQKGSLHLFVHPKWCRIIFGITLFWPIFDLSLVPKYPIFKAFCDFGGAKMACNGLKVGSKWAHFPCLGTPNGPGSFLENHIFEPFGTHFWSQNCPFSRHFGIFGGPKRATTGSKCAKNTCFGIPCGPGSFLKKVFSFCTRWTLLTHFGTHLFGLPLAACRSPLGLGTGV